MPRKRPRPAAQHRRAKLKAKMQQQQAAPSQRRFFGGLALAALIANTLRRAK